MNAPEYTVLDSDNPLLVERYERALFRAFCGIDTVVLERVWQFDWKARRVRTAIPYASQEICVGSLDGSILSGVATNVDMAGPLQLESMGFTIDRTTPGVCEGLGLFNLQPFSEGPMMALGLRDFAFERLRARAVRIMYGTCTRKRLRGYEALGWSAVDSRRFEKGTVYLIARSFP